LKKARIIAALICGFILRNFLKPRRNVQVQQPIINIIDEGSSGSLDENKKKNDYENIVELDEY